MKDYDDLLKALKVFLKAYGFSKKSTNFVREVEDFYQVINFQRDKYSTKEEVLFTINIGVVSKKILEHRKFKFFNNLMHNQWHERISNLMGKSDLWFTINNTVDILVLIKQITEDLLNFVLPALQQYSDELVIIKKLWAHIENGKMLPYNAAEDLLILVVESFPEKTEEVVILCNSKVKDSNDRLFIAEIMRELGISD